MKKPDMEMLKTQLFEIGSALQKHRISLEYGLKEEANKAVLEFIHLIKKWAKDFNIGIYIEERRRYVEPNSNHFSFTQPLIEWVPGENEKNDFYLNYFIHLLVGFRVEALKGHPVILPDGIEVSIGHEEEEKDDKSDEDTETSPTPTENQQFQPLGSTFDIDFLKKIEMKNSNGEKS